MITFDGSQPLMEDTLWWKTTFDGRQPLPKLRYFTSSFLGVLIGWTKIVGYCQKQNFAGIFSNSIKGFENWRKSRPITYQALTVLTWYQSNFENIWIELKLSWNPLEMYKWYFIKQKGKTLNITHACRIYIWLKSTRKYTPL